MLLKKVERNIRTRLNVIIKHAEKVKLCDKPYDITIGEIGLSEDNFLTTDTAILINGKPFTTFYGHRIYGRKRFIEPNKEPNPPFYLECGGFKVKIGYVNAHDYLHLPDFLSAQLLYFNGGVTAVSYKTILVFGDEGVDVYEHTSSVTTPYYLYNVKFDYTANADLLAKIIGIVDVYKRGLLTKSDPSKYIYFLYPYVSLVLYKRLKTTLYPSYISMIVKEVFDKVKSDVESIVNEYASLGEEKVVDKILDDIKAFNSTDKIIVKVLEQSGLEVFYKSQ
jgi:hypothetical protein